MVSVTTVLDYYTEPELLAWYLREGKAKCEKIGAEAKRIGAAVDLMVRQDIQKLGYAIPLNDLPVANAMSAWELFKQQRPELVAAISGFQTELTDGEVVGHPDLFITQPHRIGIIDVKTSKAIQPKYWTQTGKYLALWQQQASLTLPGFIGVLRLDKLTGQPEYVEISNPAILTYEAETFDHYLATYLHGQTIREVMRQLREREALDAS